MYFTQGHHFFLPIAKQNHAKSRKKIAGIHIPVTKQAIIASNARIAIQPHIYFGQPSGGFFFCSDCLTACCHGPFSFRTSGLGPGADAGRGGALRFAFFCAIGFNLQS
jgi:hypothetical protein